MSADAIVLGGGANELVAAHVLARAGRKVVVLDPHTLHDDEGWVPPHIVRGLGLDRAGLAVDRADPWLTIPLAGGGALELTRDVARSAEAIRRVSARDAARWPEFCARMARLAALLRNLYAKAPPDPARRGMGALARQVSVALRVRRLGRAGIDDLLRILPSSVADLLDDWFETDALKAALAAQAIRHLRHGPRAGGTAFALLHRHAGSEPGVFGPARSNVLRALAALGGIEIRRSAALAAIDVRDGRVAGVTLTSGEQVPAALVLSGLDPRRTLLELVDPGWLDPHLVRAVRNVRARGVTARVTLTLDRAPGFAALAVTPSLDALERAADDGKYGCVSQDLWLEARAGDASADGRHRVDVHVQCAPYALADGGWDTVRAAALGDRVVHALSAHLPGGEAAVVERSVLTPLDLERAAGWPEGQPHHAELALDQLLWMRPTPALASYRAPVSGLYLCGPAMHPGPGVLGAGGAIAAHAALRSAQ